MDREPPQGLSRIQASSRRTWRIQRKVYVRSDDFARGLLRHACGSRARNLSKLLSTRNALAIHRNTFGGLSGFAAVSARRPYQEPAAARRKSEEEVVRRHDQTPSVLGIRHETVSGNVIFFRIHEDIFLRQNDLPWQPISDRDRHSGCTARRCNL